MPEVQETQGSLSPHDPLSVVTEPFSRITRDIVAENQYVLMICNYGMVPEAVPLRTIDAPTIAEELMEVFETFEDSY